MKCKICSRAVVKGSKYCKGHTPAEFREGRGASCSSYRQYIERMFLRQAKINEGNK